MDFELKKPSLTQHDPDVGCLCSLGLHQKDIVSWDHLSWANVTLVALTSEV